MAVYDSNGRPKAEITDSEHGLAAVYKYMTCISEKPNGTTITNYNAQPSGRVGGGNRMVTTPPTLPLDDGEVSNTPRKIVEQHTYLQYTIIIARFFQNRKQYLFEFTV